MKRLQTILFGNGLNRLSASCPLWGDLLDSISMDRRKIPDFEKIPFTFQYEALLPNTFYTPKEIALSGASYQVQRNAEQTIKGRLCPELRAIQPNLFYERLARLNVRNYMTTNYEYLLHDTIRNLYGYRREDVKRERKYSIKRKTCLHNGHQVACNIWSIHGEIDRPDSLMLGLEHYGESLSRIEAYVKGRADHQDVRGDSIENRMREDRLSDGISWIDLFFASDVHIVGHGLDYSETDLWWILSHRMKLFRKLAGEIEPNKIFYYGDLSPDKAHLLGKFGVRCERFEVTDGNFHPHYEQIFALLERRIGLRRQ